MINLIETPIKVKFITSGFNEDLGILFSKTDALKLAFRFRIPEKMQEGFDMELCKETKWFKKKLLEAYRAYLAYLKSEVNNALLVEFK